MPMPKNFDAAAMVKQPFYEPKPNVCQEERYKTELCKNWIEIGRCRFNDTCRFAHGLDDLNHSMKIFDGKPNPNFKKNNCGNFYGKFYCNYGYKCVFRHEKRKMVQIHRHHYTPHFYVFESLYAISKDKAHFIESYERDTNRLAVFSDIHAEYDEYENELHANSLAS